MNKVMVVLPTLGTGGGERIAASIAENFSHDKMEILFVILYSKQDSANEKRLDNIDNLKVMYLNKKKGADFSVIGQLRKVIRSFKPDVIHTHLYVVPYVLFAAPRKIKKYHTVHNVAQKEAFGMRRKIHNFAFKFGNFTPVAISHLCAETIEEVYGIKKDSIPCIYNGIDIKHYVPEPTQHEGFRVVNVGRLQPQKNQALAIRSFAKVHAKHPHTVLEIVGEAELRGELERLVSELGLSDCVFLTGQTDNVKEKLNSADVFLQSSDFEGLPVSVLEAMACGLPIISTKAGGTVDIVTEENGILVDVRDEQGLVRAMMKLIEDKTLRLSMAKKSREISLAYSIQICAKQYEELFLKN
jgi:glycosyltransferase involved in cell wall biosynthesis